MDDLTRTQIDELRSADSATQNAAYHAIMAATEQPVDWSYEVWDEMVAGLTDPDNHVRAISSQVLCQLAAHSDPNGRILDDFDTLLNVTRDDRFVTARHCLQTIWQVALGGGQQRQVVVDGLTRRYQESATEKNGTLIRYDIQVDLRHLYDAAPDEALKTLALSLIDQEPDAKYRKKYAGAWKGL